MVKLRIAVALMAAMITSGPLHADKPSWAGKGGDKGEAQKGQGKSKHDEGRGNHNDSGDHGHGGSVKNGAYFTDSHRVVVREYYGGEFRTGRCPPGLAKKHNGCMPPGQAKKWRIGSRLPPDVIYYEVPSVVVTRIGPPPSGYRYVRVAADILMIAIGTAMVVDAIQDIGAM